MAYPKNYLKHVISRIDFLSPQNSLKNSIPASITQAIKELFPIPEPREVFESELKLSSSSVEVEEKQMAKFMEWNFFGKNREKRLCIGQKFMFVEFKIYTSFNDFGNHFSKVLNSLFDAFKDLQVERFGLRYINKIETNAEDANNLFNWNEYLNDNLLSIFNIPDKKTKIVRAFHNLEINYEDFILRFQYRMYNPDYPASIKKKQFILDYDAYMTGILDKEDILENLSVFHEEIEKLFEKSITDNLRAKMNEE